MPAREAVNHPAHYGGEDNPYEHVKVAKALGWVGNAFIYNCTKYLWRSGGKYVGVKNGAAPLEDLRKAKWYLERAIAEEEAAEARRQKERQERESQIDRGVTDTNPRELRDGIWVIPGPPYPSQTFTIPGSQLRGPVVKPDPNEPIPVGNGDPLPSEGNGDPLTAQDLTTFGEFPPDRKPSLGDF